MRYLLATFIFLLTGCEQQFRTTDALCDAHPELCVSLNNGDGQCRNQRTDLIWQRFESKQHKNELNLYTELQFTHDYLRCIERVSGIEHIEQKERKTNRVDSLLATQEIARELQQTLSTSTNPEVIYYLWRLGDEKAKYRFLELEGSTELNTPYLQFALASFYTSEDKDKTLELLHYGLSLVESSDNLEPRLISTIATIYHQSGHHAEAYTWSKVATHFNLPVSDDARLRRLYPLTASEYRYYNELASVIAKDINRGRYKAGHYIYSSSSAG
ncbi:DUF2989 domain-containing protein [Thaumasiovibrio sp. DFM-14]|uniref:DUF2989 domain-containing protein n=1 Tax=Thaumasiovibrio sp. DFM-14 TaxID=3384792 RepID=UPI00399FDEDB